MTFFALHQKKDRSRGLFGPSLALRREAITYYSLFVVARVNSSLISLLRESNLTDRPFARVTTTSIKRN